MRIRLWAVLAVVLGLVPCHAQTLTGAGATFPAPIYQKWIESFTSRHPGMPIVYHPVGSEAGLQQFSKQKVDFAASDYPPSPELQKKLDAHLIATVLGGAVPAYNVPHLSHELHFTSKLLAAIYLGKITRWDDPAIQALNREETLPGEKINVIHRADGSGTSYVWSCFLTIGDPAWRNQAGVSMTPHWPTGQSAQGNQGVADLVAQTPYSIGYMEFIYALHSRLQFGLVQNAAGNFIPATIDSLTAAAATASGDIEDGVAIVNAPGPDSYPIASFTWLLIPEHMPPGPKRDRLKEFLDWALTFGEKQVGALGYIGIPRTLADTERGRIGHAWQR